jgi:RNA-binding protein 18
LKLLQQYGAIEKFDLLFHRTGPLSGQPRGYAFITYSSIKDATRALKELHGKMVGTKNIAVRFAHSVPKVRNFRCKLWFANINLDDLFSSLNWISKSLKSTSLP